MGTLPYKIIGVFKDGSPTLQIRILKAVFQDTAFLCDEREAVIYDVCIGFL